MKTYALQLAEADAWRLTGGEADYCSQDGAQALKHRIEAYWAARGHHVIVALHNVGFHPAIRAARYDVRSDMINGRPRRTSSLASERAVDATFDLETADLA